MPHCIVVLLCMGLILTFLALGLSAKTVTIPSEADGGGNKLGSMIAPSDPSSPVQKTQP
jgi:hypothetical protein